MSSMQSGQPGTSPGGHGLGLSLLVIATAQLMLVLDDTIANIALPSIQRELTVSAATLPWIINAYILAFGGLLLFGGRVGDLLGDAGCSARASACSPSPRCSVGWAVTRRC